MCIILKSIIVRTLSFNFAILNTWQNVRKQVAPLLKNFQGEVGNVYKNLDCHLSQMANLKYFLSNNK